MIKLQPQYKILLALFILLMITSLWTYNIYLLVFFSILTYIVLPYNKECDTTSLVLFLFSIVYSVTVLLTNQVTSYFILLAYAISPVAFYRFGRWLMSVFQLPDERYAILLCIIVSYLLPLFILTLRDISIVGIVNVNRSMGVDHNSNETLSATYYGLVASVGIGYCSSIFARNQKTVTKVVSILVALLSILVVVHLVNRTGLVVAVISLFASLVFSYKFKMNKIILPLLCLAVLCFLVIKFGLVSDDLIAAYQYRETDSSHSIQNAGGRLELWKGALNNLLSHPLGWPRESYAHNLWLDVAGVGGVIPMALLLLSTSLWLKSLAILFRKSLNSFNVVLFSINIAMLFSVMVEPVLDCSVLYFSMFIMIWGITKSAIKEKTY